MFWKNKIKEPKKGRLTELECEIFNCVMTVLPDKYSFLLQEQVKYLTLLKRLEYKNDVITELYPEKYGIIPKEILLTRTEEFRLANIKFSLSNIIYMSEIHMVMGQIFDIKITPKPLNSITSNLEILKISIDENLEKNKYG